MGTRVPVFHLQEGFSCVPFSFINYHRAYNPRLFRLQNRIAHQENQLSKSEDDKRKSSTHTEKVKEFQKVSLLRLAEKHYTLALWPLLYMCWIYVSYCICLLSCKNSNISCLHQSEHCIIFIMNFASIVNVIVYVFLSSIFVAV